MGKLFKVECLSCEGRYYVDEDSINVPGDINSGEAFPNKCPLCEEGDYALIPKTE